jgi:hypothetical protein
MRKKSTKSRHLSAAQITPAERRLICDLLHSLVAREKAGENIAVARRAKSALSKMQKRRKVRTVAELVEAMGGAKATAAWAGVDRWWIDEWSKKRGGFIPPGWHYSWGGDRSRAFSGE